ncbi:hypothetical protein AX17_001954 [Amanita inopinata Kibby_2008]|nr:hypothetical protein AX17_001954 [Amanita inopinata Kibby_2008]
MIIPKSRATSTLMDRDETPKIGGSTVGFIVLIVCLVLIILVSSSAIMCLVRQERRPNGFRPFTRRRQRGYEQRNASASPYSYNSSSEPRQKSWARRLINFFHIRRATINSPSRGIPGSKQARCGGNGWHQTGSNDAWDYPGTQSTETHKLTIPESYTYPSATPRSGSPTADLYLPGASPVPRLNRDSLASSSVRFELPDSHIAMSPTPLTLLERNSPTPYTIFPSIRTQLSSSLPPSASPSPALANSPPLRCASTDPFRGSPRSLTDSPVSMQAGVSIRTFEGGSKFLEAL